MELIVPGEIQLKLERLQPTAEVVSAFVSHLRVQGWQTRQQLVEIFGCNERWIRKVAEAAGTDVVRGPRGFACLDQVNSETADHCAEIAISQGKKMIRWGIGVKRRLHQRIG